MGRKIMRIDYHGVYGVEQDLLALSGATSTAHSHVTGRPSVAMSNGPSIQTTNTPTVTIITCNKTTQTPKKGLIIHNYLFCGLI